MRELIALVHDEATQSAELGRVLHGLREDVTEVLLGRHEGHLEFERLNHVADEEVAALHVLHAVVVLRVVGDVACA